MQVLPLCLNLQIPKAIIVADWGDIVCLLAAPWVQLSVSAGNGWPHNALRHHRLMPISCHFRDCKALLVDHESDSSKRRYSKCPDLFCLVLDRIMRSWYTGR